MNEETKNNVNLISSLDAFDKEFYKSQFSEDVVLEINPIQHYLNIGWIEGKNPSSWFNTNYYLKEYPDVKEAGINPLIHFINSGSKEKRRPNRLMTPAFMNILSEIISASEMVRTLKRHHEFVFGPYNDSKKIVVPINSKANYFKNNKEYYKGKEINNLLNPYFDKEWYGNMYGVPPERSWQHFVNFGEILALYPCKQLIGSIERLRLELDDHWFIKFMNLKHRFDYMDFNLLNESQKCYEIYISGLFDSSWYSVYYQEIEDNSTSLSDFSLNGIFEDRNPNQYFNSQWYRNRYNLADYQLPLIHYIRNWRLLTFNPSKDFVTTSYIKNHPKLYEKFIEPLAHFINNKDDENVYNIESNELKINIFNKSPLFMPDWYRLINTDLSTVDITSIEHFVLYGEFEGRRPNPYFDPKWYKEYYSLDDDKSPLYHYLTEGYLNDNNPSSEFNSKFYLKENNLQEIDVSALEHYLLIGKKQGLSFKQSAEKSQKGVVSVDVKEQDSEVKLAPSKNDLNDYGFKFHIDSKVDGVVNGWIYNKSKPQSPIVFEVYIGNKFANEVIADIKRKDLKALDIGSLEHGFHINTKTLSNTPIYTFSVYEKETQQPLIENQLVFPLLSKVDAFLELQTFLRKQSFDKTQSHYAYYIINSLLPDVVQAIRNGELKLSIPNLQKLDRKDITHEIGVIDIIIPVYKGIEETRNCILSVLKSTNKVDFNLIVINDKSPEPDMSIMLKELANQYAFELVNNEENYGFVKTVNVGMRKSNNDIILLNSDTLVSNGWLDSIYFEAYEADESSSVGTVTPMSNNATICSFPRFCLDNELPETFNLSMLAEVSQTNTIDAVDLPTAHGYCMFIKREVLSKVGYFDEQKWGKGYAEENDFSLRANNLGWRNVMTNKTFVQHLGSVSFAENTEEFIRVNLEKLNSIYPDYAPRVAEFVNRDPVRFLRNELAEKLLVKESKTISQSKRRSILFVSLTIGGGTQKATEDLSRLLKDEAQNSYMLTSKSGVVWTLRSMESNLEAVYHVENEIEYKRLLEVLIDLGVWHIHYHHVIEFPKKVWDLPYDLKCEYDITLHDFYSICPRVNMLTLGNKYCHQPPNDVCNEDCLPQVGVHPNSYLTLADFNDDINRWQYYFMSKMSEARKVFTPSRDTKERILRKIPINNIVSKYHPEPVEPVTFKHSKFDNKLLRIGFIGAIGPHKGLEIIKSLTNYISQEKLQIEIVIFGYTSEDSFFNSYDFVKITGKYQAVELESLILENIIDVMFLTSIWPETYGYTFSEILRLGLPIVSFDIGAVPERSLGLNNVLIIDEETTEKVIIDEVISFLKTVEDSEYEVGYNYKSILKDYYNI